MVEYNVVEEDDNIEEDDDVEEKLVDRVLDHEDVKEVQGIYLNQDNANLDELYDIDMVSDEELEEVEPNVEEHVPDDDIYDDDDANMVNPL